MLLSMLEAYGLMGFGFNVMSRSVLGLRALLPEELCAKISSDLFWLSFFILASFDIESFELRNDYYLNIKEKLFNK